MADNSDNSIVYRSARNVRAYGVVKQALTVAEENAFKFVPRTYRGSVLDIGIGTGRTTGPLRKMFNRYVGIDYSTEMVRHAKQLFPENEIYLMDARNIVLHEQYDCAFFSFNGIDYIGEHNRKLALNEVTRVIKPGGYFIYSTHNLGYGRVNVFLERFWVRELVPSGVFHRPKRLAYLPRNIFNRYRNFKRQERVNLDAMAYVNDPGLNFSLLTTYVDIPTELETLRRYDLRVISTIGNLSCNGYNAADNWVYLVAQKNSRM